MRLLRIVPDDTNFDFIRFRRISFPISALLSIVALVAFFTMGLNFGIDFKGGTMVELQSQEGAIDLDDVYSRLDELNIGDVKIERFKSDDRTLITVGSQGGGEDAEQTVGVKIRNEFQDEYNLPRVDVIGPSVSSELSQAGILAVVLTLVVIFAYVWFRF